MNTYGKDATKNKGGQTFRLIVKCRLKRLEHESTKYEKIKYM